MRRLWDVGIRILICFGLLGGTPSDVNPRTAREGWAHVLHGVEEPDLDVECQICIQHRICAPKTWKGVRVWDSGFILRVGVRFMLRVGEDQIRICGEKRLRV